MGRKKHTTRKQRQANNGKIEQTQRFENNAQGITASLGHTKNQNQYITDAIEEVDTVSPGNGLMPDQIPKISREKYFNFINSTFAEALKSFGENLFFKKGHDYVCINEFIIADSNGNKITALNHEKEDGWYFKTESTNLNANYTYQHNSTEAISLKVIADFIFNSVFSQRKKGELYGIDSCENFNKTDLFRFLKNVSNTSTYNFYFTEEVNHKKSVRSPFKCNFKPTEVTTGSAILNTTSAQFLASTTTPAISYNNSTVANIDLTTSTPEREDNTNLEVMIGSVVGAFLVGVGAAVLCYRKCYRIGTYRTGEPKTEDISSYVKNEEVDKEALLDQSNGNSDKQNQPQASASSSYTNISETKSKEEKKPLLSEQGKLDASDNEVKISDDNIVAVQQALKGKCQFSSCKAAEPQKVLMSQEELNSKFDEILKIIPNSESNGEARSEQISSVESMQM